MEKRYFVAMAVLLSSLQGAAQPQFTNGTAMLAHAASSGGCMAVTDMDGDGLDDVVQLDNSRHVYVLYQEADGSFTAVDHGAVSSSSQWGWAMADLDNDGHKDICSAGNFDGVHLLKITARGSFSLINLNGPSIFQQCMSMADVDNDGRVDVCACNDVGAPNLYLTDASGIPQYNGNYIDWSTVPASDMSGNYGSCFADVNNDGHLDLHIAHCRQGVNNPNDPRRWNRLFINDGNGQWTDEAAARGADDHEQTWATDFGDFDNDGDLDMVSIEHSTGVQLYANDGNGHFTNVTAGSGLGTANFPLQVLFRDLDNDGFLDVLIAGGSEFFYQGNGDGTFTRVQNVFPYTKAMHSFAFGDLDRDGFEDVYANYGNGYVDASSSNPDILWLNTPNGNHFFRVRLIGTTSNRDAVGARVTINGPWGTQVREVRAGESYGLVNSFILSFGLGAETLVPTMTVRWPSGLEETFSGLHADQTLTVVEGSCISPNASIQGTPTTTLCTGGAPIVLNAGSAGEVQWNTGITANSITVTQPGNYFYTTGVAPCLTQANVHVRLDPDETPVVSALGPTIFCPGDHVVLTSSPAAVYAWSNGGEGQSITVEDAGSYTVTVQGACSNFMSAPITVGVLQAPAPPMVQDVVLPEAGTALLQATGDSVRWYAAETGGAPIGHGSPWASPWVDTDSTFWAASAGENGGAVYNGGKIDKSITGVYQNNATYYLLFSTQHDMVLKSVKVYANGAGVRSIALVDKATDATVFEQDFNLPDGESRIQFNWTIPAGGEYGLRAVAGDPQLWRDGLGTALNYPYDVGGLATITGSSSGSTSYYYFFYDWEVATPAMWCESARSPVHVHVGTTGITGQAEVSPFKLYPNPAQDRIVLEAATLEGARTVQFLDLSGRACLSAGIIHGTNNIDVSPLAPGVYTVRTTDGKAAFNAGFIKQ